MKRVIILVILFTFIACSSENDKSKKSDVDSTAALTSDSIGKTVKENDKKPREVSGYFDVTLLGESIWEEKFYGIYTISDYYETPIDSATLNKFLHEYNVLDASRQSGEFKGDTYNYDVEYYYYNIHELDNYYILTLVEKILNGPEYSIYGVTISKKDNKIIDSEIIAGIWTDQYEADLLVDYSDEYHFQVEKSEINMIATEPADTLAHSFESYSYTVNDEGFLIKSMIDKSYYKTTFWDYEKGLLNYSGERENVLFIILPDFDIKIPGFYEGEYGPSENYEGLTVDRFRDYGDIILNFSLGGIYGREGKVFDNDFTIFWGEDILFTDFIEFRYTTTLLFNDDGSGGVYEIPEVGNYESAWVPIEEVDNSVFHIPSKEIMKNYKEAISEVDRQRAEKYSNSQEWKVYYSEEVINAVIRITWTKDNKKRVLLINFDFEYGD